jgi:Sulfotransferase family
VEVVILAHQLDHPAPIFISGIMPRSGTNHLMDLVCLHPYVAPARRPVMEDFFLEHSDHLLTFASEVRGSWDPIWGEFPPDIEADLLRSLGEGLTSFLWKDRSRRLVTKSPSVKNIARFHLLFPRGKLLILIRDGRSIVQSCLDTFGWDFDTAAHRYSEAAGELLAFLASGEKSSGRLVVRYEELVMDMRTTMTRVLDFLELPADKFDFSAAETLPVRGSSVHLGPGRADVHWEPVSKDESFRPLERWESWNDANLARFAWIAGRESRALGYESGGSEMPVLQLLRDVQWYGIRSTRRAVYRLRGKLGPMTRPLRDRLKSLARNRRG